MHRNGIFAAGNWIVDHVKIIDTWPQQDALANILAESKGNGGSPYNILKNLSKLGAEFPLEAAGLIGDDANGHAIVEDCRQLHIDTSQLHVKEGCISSYTDVMTVKSTGRRTFFHARGTNDEFSIEHVNFEQTSAKIFHLGYMLLLKKLDEVDEKGRTGASYLFEKASQSGMSTSADLVSESSERFKKVITPSLPFVDYLFLNEFEAGRLTGIDVGDSEKVDRRAVEQALRQILDFGVKQWIFLHFTYGCYAIHSNGRMFSQPALKIPKQLIQGATGAGDAFASGALMRLHQHADIDEVLLMAVCSAASSLFAPECSASILPANDTLALAKQYGFY